MTTQSGHSGAILGLLFSHTPMIANEWLRVTHSGLSSQSSLSSGLLQPKKWLTVTYSTIQSSKRSYVEQLEQLEQLQQSIAPLKVAESDLLQQWMATAYSGADLLLHPGPHCIQWPTVRPMNKLRPAVHKSARPVYIRECTDQWKCTRAHCSARASQPVQQRHALRYSKYNHFDALRLIEIQLNMMHMHIYDLCAITF